MKPNIFIYILSFGFVFLPYFCKAQQHTSEIDTVQQTLRYFSIESPMWLQEMTTPRFTKLAIQYAGEQGSYRTAQDAQKARNINFDSEGTITLQDVRLWGRFAYSNIAEDSTRFGHQTRHNLSAPLYFASYGFNHYERTLYTIQARGQRYWSDRKFSVFGGLDYNVGDHFSNNDPRGSIDEIRLDASLGGSIRIAKGLDAGTEALYGYGQENVEVAFKNENYNSSPVKSPYLNYIVKGYGWQVRDYLTNMFYQNDYHHIGANAYLSAQTAAGKFYAKSGYRYDQQKYRQVLRSEQRTNELNNYKLYTWSNQLMWFLAKDNRSYRFTLHTEITDGKDFDVQNNINNYIYRSEDYTASLAYSLRGKKWNQYYELTSGWNAEKRHDGGSGTLLDYGIFSSSASANYAYKLAENQSIEFGLTGLLSRPTRTVWELPEINENVFHEYVFYHDILFRSAETWGGRARIAYKHPIYKHYTGRLSLEGGMRKASHFKTIDRASLSIPGNRRTDFKIKMELIF
ncbi:MULTISPECIES: DUF6850 family outer membrane beta-barrel protein [unclassified Sphingobacterium]|uniref:DUF6850 family outer membrane beta-barrel protein n=1 Tax=unclassified Sphingobacterium TaxID=2609468 RepID=UPI0025DD5B25|nr:MULTISPECIES: DUF6850 family outer membrane beta-barrel protein [unclassified Sphingobacterium]